jgi:hypothetical protein
LTYLATDPFTDLRLYVGGDYNANLFISADGGTTYHTVTLPIPSIYTGGPLFVGHIAPDPYHAGHLLTGVTIPFGSAPDHSSWRGGFYSSDDYGEHWQWIEVGHTIQPVSSLVYDPSEPLIVYAGTDGGQTWTVANGLNQGDVSSLATTTDGKRVIIYVGVSGGAINNSVTESSIVAKAVSETRLLGSGVYRYVQDISIHQLFLPLILR